MKKITMTIIAVVCILMLSVGSAFAGNRVAHRKTRNTISESFSSILIPHFDVDRVIRYKDEDYIIDSLYLDLAGRKMTVGASNVSFLPQNWGLTSYE